MKIDGVEGLKSYRQAAERLISAAADFSNGKQKDLDDVVGALTGVGYALFAVHDELLKQSGTPPVP